MHLKIMTSLLALSVCTTASAVEPKPLDQQILDLNIQLQYANSSEVTPLSNQMQNLLKEAFIELASSATSHIDTYPLVNQIIAVQQNPNYQYQTISSTKQLIQSYYKNNDYINAYSLIQPLSMKRSLLYDYDLYTQLLLDCKKHNSVCAAHASNSEKMANFVSADTEEKEDTAKRIAEINANTHPSHDDVFFYLTALGKGYPLDRGKLEKMLMFLGYQGDLEALNTLRQSYTTSSYFQVDDLKLASVNYILGVITGDNRNSLYQEAISMFDKLGDRGDVARSNIDKQLLLNGIRPLNDF